ncbi:MAG: hypothetical protein AUG49_11730 [Catenulispora sp. 13_1_20CM_3_70_7]|nr:MAG: hypothetical protein AUG49_11730 [Catenulispora sp. 13_1_20CM_3_70_7]
MDTGAPNRRATSLGLASRSRSSLKISDRSGWASAVSILGSAKSIGGPADASSSPVPCLGSPNSMSIATP